MTIWIVGPVAWDTVVYTEEFLVQGGSTQGKKFIERSGGTGANVARALCTSGVETGFVGYLGDDSYGEQLEAELRASKIAKLYLTKVPGPSSHVLILVDNSGDRTILGLAPDRLDLVNLENVPLAEGDTVVFVIWREHFLGDVRLAREKKCHVVVGLEAINSPELTDVDLAIGSHNDVSRDFNPKQALNRFKRIVITRGAEGSIEYSTDGETSHPAEAVSVLDATGAGDAFLAGYLTAMSDHKNSAAERLALGSKWAAKTIQIESSVPPPFNTL
jgi:sugar/nucleoside kinase (ribokinase family)